MPYDILNTSELMRNAWDGMTNGDNRDHGADHSDVYGDASESVIRSRSADDVVTDVRSAMLHATPNKSGTKSNATVAKPCTYRSSCFSSQPYSRATDVIPDVVARHIDINANHVDAYVDVDDDIDVFMNDSDADVCNNVIVDTDTNNSDTATNCNVTCNEEASDTATRDATTGANSRKNVYWQHQHIHVPTPSSPLSLSSSLSLPTDCDDASLQSSLRILMLPPERILMPTPLIRTKTTIAPAVTAAARQVASEASPRPAAR